MLYTSMYYKGTCMLIYIACLCPNLVSVHFYAITILHSQFLFTCHTVWYYCVYRDCYGLSPLKTIYKDFVQFHFQFEVDFTFNDIKVKNV